MGLFREVLPVWCTNCSLDEYTRGKHDEVRTERLEILRHNPAAWQLSGTRAVLLMEPITLRKLPRNS